MLRALLSGSVVLLLLAGCAHVPQVNRAAKADKHAAPKTTAPAPMPTPNQIVKKNWFPKFKVKWLHSK